MKTSKNTGEGVGRYNLKDQVYNILDQEDLHE